SGSPSTQRVVIIGAGIVGNSLAYHLTRLGVTEITLLDKGPLPRPGGSTGHASNFIFPVDHNKQLTELITESMRQYEALGLRMQCGGVEVARTEARMQELERRIDSGIAYGVEQLEMISPARIKELVPYLEEGELLGGFYSPTASVVESVPAATIMRERAVEAGLAVMDETEVLGIDVERGRVRAVQTSRGEIAADRVVIACGAWSPRIARMAGARIPLTPMIHQMIEVGPVPRFAGAKQQIEWPIIRDMDNFMYEHQKWEGLHIGSYAHRPIALSSDEIPSLKDAELSPTEMPFTEEDFAPQLAAAHGLMPEILEDPSVKQYYAINGVLSVTFDGLPLLGETPEVRGLWSAAAVWVREGPAVGKTLAELMVHGDSEIDIHGCDIARAHPHQRTRAHVLARANEGFPKMYGIVHPAEQWGSDRPNRLAPFHDRQQALGASFIETGGWERPNWYESNAGLVEEYRDRIPVREAEWDARWWSPIINAEHLAMRDRAAVIDLTAFAIFDVTGPGALDAVQWIAMRQMDVAIGRVVYTPILSPSGGFKADLTIMRLADDVFRVVTGAAHGMADFKWFADHLPADGSGAGVQIHDRTNAYSTLGLWGPRARDILETLTADDISHEGLAFGRCREISVGSLPVLISRISYVGDLGWELYVPFEQGTRLWDALFEAGAPHGLIPAGIGVYNTTGRLEKGYRAYGAELDSDYDVVEAGMAWGKVKDQDFVGKEAHVAQRESEPVAHMCTLTVEDHTSSDGVKRYMPANVPILDADGRPLVDAKGRTSYVTSAGSGPSLGAYLLMGYLPPEQAVVGTELSVRYLGDRYPVTVRSADSTSLFDPDNARIRS
ncbi:MAG TPA: FAD-dependent oxidoreductase, partial [Solirubrobacteraceae bacterium]|nr:FAD-dependent oxidoreductase [Solirubrobacteraceae bacterium]